MLLIINLFISMKVSSVNRTMSRKREHRVLLMVITMVIFYLLCWLPYGIVALLATFGAPGLVTAEASIVPSILAKSSTVINPVIYIFMNKQVSIKKAGAPRLGKNQKFRTWGLDLWVNLNLNDWWNNFCTKKFNSHTVESDVLYNVF